MIPHVSELPYRQSCRAVLVDPEERVLLAQHTIPEGEVWVAPGGGVEGEESHDEALARELHEETGLVLTDAHDPRLLWLQSFAFPDLREHGWDGVTNHFYLVRTTPFELASGVASDDPGHPSQEGILAMRWWSLDEIDEAHARGVLFSPRALPALLRDVLRDGPPVEPLVLGL